jgi:hypothetical protein
MLCALLGLIGCQPSAAGTAAEALELIAGGRFDLYFTAAVFRIRDRRRR